MSQCLYSKPLFSLQRLILFTLPLFLLGCVTSPVDTFGAALATLTPPNILH